MRVASLLVVSVIVAGCSESAFAPEAIVVQPRCVAPAPLLGSFDPGAPHFIVVFDQGIESSDETPRLAERYGFTPRFVYTHALEGFSAALEPGVVAAIRCERSVRYVEYDGVVSIATPAA
jgi:hypothetical protein